MKVTPTPISVLSPIENRLLVTLETGQKIPYERLARYGPEHGAQELFMQ